MATTYDFPPVAAWHRPEAGLAGLTLSLWETDEGINKTGWDYATNLHFRRRFEVDAKRLADELNLENGSELRILVEWHSSLNPRLRGGSRIHRVVLGSRDSQDVLLGVEVPGYLVGGTLHLTSMVCVGRDERNQIPAGTVVWNDEVSIDLEEEEKQLPVSLVDFEKYPDLFPDVRARWHVHLSADAWEQRIRQAIQVFVNLQYEKLASALTTHEEDSELSGVGFFSFDVVRQILISALSDEEFAEIWEQNSFPAGSLGKSVQLLLGTCFAGSSLAEVRALLHQEPRRFEAHIQSKLMEV